MKNSFFKMLFCVALYLMPKAVHAKLDSIPVFHNPSAALELPTCPFNRQELIAFFQDNLEYPELARLYGIEGTVIVKFMVGRTGKIHKIRIEKSLGFGLDKAARKLVQQMPPWNPGKQFGQPFETEVKMPIAFSLQ